MKLFKMTFLASAVLMLGGCMVVPVNSDYPAQPVGYYQSYSPPRVYYGPSFGIGIYGDRGRWNHGHGHRHGHWRR